MSLVDEANIIYIDEINDARYTFIDTEFTYYIYDALDTHAIYCIFHRDIFIINFTALLYNIYIYVVKLYFVM